MDGECGKRRWIRDLASPVGNWWWVGYAMLVQISAIRIDQQNDELSLALGIEK